MKERTVPRFLAKAEFDDLSAYVSFRSGGAPRSVISVLIHTDRTAQPWPSSSIAPRSRSHGETKPEVVHKISVAAGDQGAFDGEAAERFAASLTQRRREDVAQVLSGLWRVFDRYEGLWFTYRLSLNDGGVEILLAEKGCLFYRKLPPPLAGNVGCFGYGASNAMSTMYGLDLARGRPANFLDGGGGSNRQNAMLAIETLNRDNDVRAIFVNCLVGITRTDVVAQGIVDAVRENCITKPVVVRMRGTGSEEAAKVMSFAMSVRRHSSFDV
ncbi:hypothetical protein ACQY0O_000641 [Thecaphora frezii]